MLAQSKPMSHRLFALFFLLAPVIVFAQSTDTIQLEDVVVAENRIQLPWSQQTRPVTLLTQKEIQSTPARSVAELLSYVAGVDIRQRGVHGIQADISIRGSSFDQVLVLVNGIKLNDPQTGHHNLNLPVDLEQVERIELLKGPGARIFGQNAFAGAINIITKKPRENSLRAGVQAGDFGLWGASLSGALAKEKSSHYLSLTHQQSEGYKYNTDYRLSQAFYQSHIQWGLHQLEWMAGLTVRDFGANGFYASPAFKDQYEAILTSLGAVTWTYTPSPSVVIRTRAFWRRNRDEYLFVRNKPEVYRNVHIGHQAGVELHGTWYNHLGISAVGLEAGKTDLESNNLGARSRNTLSAFAEHRFNVAQDRFSITPGININYYSDYDWVVLPGIDAGYTWKQGHRIFANWGKTFRIPTFTDLYYSDPANLGNPNLQPELANAWELGYKWFSNPVIVLQSSMFLRQGQNIIDWTKNEPSEKWKPSNILKLDTKGVEGSVRLQPQQLFRSSRIPLLYLHSNYTFLVNDPTNDAPLSRYALENLRHQWINSVGVRIYKQLEIHLTHRWIDRVNLADYQLTDLRASWDNQSWRLWIDLNNAFNTTYTETNLVTMPGRWLRGGIQYTFTQRNKKM